MSGEICTDNRFEIISAYKKALVEATNIETSPDEMAVIDNVLFRFWQMRWLNPHKTNADRIRAMTDEELADYFAEFEAKCYYRFFPDAICQTKNFAKQHLDWLRQEVEP